jgi:hypothetical protein
VAADHSAKGINLRSQRIRTQFNIGSRPFAGNRFKWMVDFHHIEIEWTKLMDVAPGVLGIRPVSRT